VRIFTAGASGVIGPRLVLLLIKEGHTVAEMTRSPDKASVLRTLGAEPVVCDVSDTTALTRPLVDFRPGPGTYYQDSPPDPPRIHLDDASRQTLPSLAAPPGVTLVVDDRATAGNPDTGP
jgi:hypothetical protein